MSDEDIKLARERFKEITDFEDDWVTQAEKEIRFEGGEQWDQAIRLARETTPDGARPCLVMNHARKHLNNLVNDFRSARPSFNVLPADSKADPETADMMNGMLRHIQVSGEASIAYDHAAKMQRHIGLGYFRIGTELKSHVTREQDITISPIRSTFAVKMDAHAKHPAARDAEVCFVVEDMAKARFKAKYPKADMQAFEGGRDTSMGMWHSESTIRVAEYWTRTLRETTLVETPHGIFRPEHLEQRAEQMSRMYGRFPVKEHRIPMPYVVCRTMSGAEFLDEKEFPADFIPIIRVVGEERWIDGKRDFRGIIRDIMDPQRVLNYEVSTNVERMSLEALASWIGMDEAFTGHEDAWASSNRTQRAYLPYNGYDAEGNPIPAPTRNIPAPSNMAAINAIQMAEQSIRELSGQPQAAFGSESNEKSGRALMAKQSQADQNTFHFNDGMSISIAHAGRVILSMIPRVYDTERMVRILGEDEKPDWAQVAPTGRSFGEMADAAGKTTRLYDLAVGTYDLIVNTGPSHLTRRTEAAEGAIQLVSSNPELWAVLGDWLVRMLDWPGAEEIADRLKLLLPPEIKQLEQAKSEGKDAATMEMQAVQQAMMAQVEPIIAELQQALEAATMEADEREQKLAELTQQLQDKRAEYELKVMEIQQRDADSQRDYEAKMASVKAGIIEKAMDDDKPPPEPTKEATPEVHVHMPSGKRHIKVNRDGEAIDSLDVTEQ